MTQDLILIPDVSLIDNSEERLPVVLVLDCSGSMAGAKIDALRVGIEVMNREIKDDPKAAKSVRILVIQFCGDHEVSVGEWQDLMDFVPPNLQANGRTPTGAAMLRALDEIEKQKEQMRQAGISYKRPLLFLMSDGEPTDDWKRASELSQAAMTTNKVTVFPIGVGSDANLEILAKFSQKGAIRLDGLKFKELFMWLSASVKTVSRTAQGQNTQLPPIDSWATVIS